MTTVITTTVTITATIIMATAGQNTNTGNRTSSSRDTGSSAGSRSRENGKWRYKNPNGTYAANEWKQLSYNGAMEWYYFGADGTMMTGWLVLNGKTYYLNLESDGTQGKIVPVGN